MNVCPKVMWSRLDSGVALGGFRGRTGTVLITARAPARSAVPQRRKGLVAFTHPERLQPVLRKVVTGHSFRTVGAWRSYGDRQGRLDGGDSGARQGADLKLSASPKQTPTFNFPLTKSQSLTLKTLDYISTR